MGKLKITLVKSPIACQPKQKKTVEALGLRKLHHSVELEDSPATWPEQLWRVSRTSQP